VKLSIIIPARNEEENIEETVVSLVKYIDAGNTEIIVVNDHSDDRTEEVVKELVKRFPFINLIRNKKEPGFANALISGFENAKGEFVLPVMADRCDAPSTIPQMLKKTEEGCDLICGSRYMKEGGKVGGPKLQGVFSMFVGKTLYFLTGIPTHDVSNAFKMYRKKVLECLTLNEKGFAVSMEAGLKLYFSGYKICEVPTIWYGRNKGKSKFKLTRTFPYVKLYFRAIFRRFLK